MFIPQGEANDRYGEDCQKLLECTPTHEKLQPHQCHFLTRMKSEPLTFDDRAPPIINKFTSYEEIHKELHWAERGWFTNFDHLANAMFHLFLRYTDPPLEGPLQYRYVWLSVTKYRVYAVSTGHEWHPSEKQALAEGRTKCPSLDVVDDDLVLTVESRALTVENSICDINMDFPAKTIDDLEPRYTLHKTVTRDPRTFYIGDTKTYLFSVTGASGLHQYQSHIKNVKASFEHELERLKLSTDMKTDRLL